ncbi:protein of unknown function [Taphrina deformans PYCC 5710]|uniref:Aquaporin n=1 Tax=Taphrina deformans (strain PYCC 5710 / ATCC 11124 / CBS 356.35 / IMI 108563 / JCM 9778 / NBRC 8474) TaxID=1097556 RepID=R4XGK4_TAPDE|nr:protein of unknown function [Taphrina deformans PYCC 5710]|eukprot:CCG83627.1 protein of unknown function [Taphrina deformans PYCC 5710]
MAVTAGVPASNVAALQKDAAVKGMAAVLAAAGKSNAAATGSFLTVGFAFGLGMAAAILMAGHVSGGHFSPALTTVAVIFDKFPRMKALRYFAAQLLGGLLAALLVYGLFHQQFVAFKSSAVGNTLELQHTLIRIFCSLPDGKQGVGYMFLTEFSVCFFMGLIIMACMDTSNPYISRPVAAFSVGMAYALSIWAFGTLNISLNTAKDFSARIVASMVIGPGAFTYKSASWVGTLVNTPAFVAAKVFYDVIFKDSKRQVELGLAKLEEPILQPFEYSTNTDHKDCV